MEIFIYLVKLTVELVVSALSFAMLIRAILSFLFLDEEGGISAFLVMITEPVIYPVRRIFDKFGIGDGIPFDIPFLVTSFILCFIAMLV